MRGGFNENQILLGVRNEKTRGGKEWGSRGVLPLGKIARVRATKGGKASRRKLEQRIKKKRGSGERKADESIDVATKKWTPN